MSLKCERYVIKQCPRSSRGTIFLFAPWHDSVMLFRVATLDRLPSVQRKHPFPFFCFLGWFIFRVVWSPNPDSFCNATIRTVLLTFLNMSNNLCLGFILVLTNGLHKPSTPLFFGNEWGLSRHCQWKRCGASAVFAAKCVGCWKFLRWTGGQSGLYQSHQVTQFWRWLVG